jgi:hypothetical protein
MLIRLYELARNYLRRFWRSARRNRLYVVIGRPDPKGGDAPYPTDPRFYGLNPLDVPESEYDGKYRDCVHAYQDEHHAASAIYRCGLEPAGAYLNVYVRIEDQWVYSEQETHRVLDETAW